MVSMEQMNEAQSAHKTASMSWCVLPCCLCSISALVVLFCQLSGKEFCKYMAIIQEQMSA